MMIENNKWISGILKDKNIALTGFADISIFDKNVRFGLDYGISIAIALDYNIAAKIPEGPFKEYYDEYKNVSNRLKEASDFLARSIKERGFEAVSVWGQKQNEEFRTPFPLKTLATRSRLGWIGRSAALVTKEYGNAVRLGGVLTDMPFVTGEPETSSLCGSCTECVTNCPGKAISGKLWDINADRDELLDPYKCKETVVDRGRALGVTEGSCGICIAVCPWTKNQV